MAIVLTLGTDILTLRVDAITVVLEVAGTDPVLGTDAFLEVLHAGRDAAEIRGAYPVPDIIGSQGADLIVVAPLHARPIVSTNRCQVEGLLDGLLLPYPIMR